MQERLWAALDRHIADDTPTFRRWFFEEADNLVHAIAKQKKQGGVLPRDATRQAVLELVFRSYMYVGDAVHTQMTAIAHALPDPLAAGELAAYNGIYRRRPYLGGLPLVLLSDRFGFLREALLDAWENPADPGPVGVVLRLLSYYGGMAARRRDADRRSKARALQRDDQGRPALVFELDPDRDAAVAPPQDSFTAVAVELARARGIGCQCGPAGGTPC